MVDKVNHIPMRVGAVMGSPAHEGTCLTVRPTKPKEVNIFPLCICILGTGKRLCCDCQYSKRRREFGCYHGSRRCPDVG